MNGGTRSKGIDIFRFAVQECVLFLVFVVDDGSKNAPTAIFQFQQLCCRQEENSTGGVKGFRVIAPCRYPDL